MASVRSVSLGIWIGTGSRDETPELSGISHFLEHMFFKGTSSRTARELAEAFDFIGGQVNAFTTKEYTCLHAKVLDQHVDVALDTLAEMLFHSVFAEDEIEREKRVVMEEIKMYEDNPDESVHDLIVGECFSGHALGASILGSEDTLSALERSDLIRYIEDRYTSDNIVISVSGHIEPGRLLARLEELFGGLRGHRRELVQGQPEFRSARAFQVRPTEQTHVCLGSLAYAVTDDRSYALVLLSNILGGSSSSRLFQEIREERGMAYSVFSYPTFFRDTGLFTVYFGSTPEQAEDVLDLSLSILRNARERGITDTEIQKAKNQVIGSMLLSLESTSSRMSRLAKNELLLEKQLDLDEEIQGVEAVTSAQMASVAEEVLKEPFAFVALGPSDRQIELRVATKV